MVTHTDPKVHMATITAGEARALYATNPIVLLPMGSHEDQGPYAPMGDYLLAEKIAELMALRATAGGTRTVVAPVVPFGGADWFDSMPGGIALSQNLLLQVLDEMIGSLLRHKLTRIVIINGHGGNVVPIGEATRRVLQRDGLVIPSLYLWQIGYGILPKAIGADKARLSAGHGADSLGSIYMHLFPEMVRKDMVPEAKPLKHEPTLDLPFNTLGQLNFDGAPVGVPFDYDKTYNMGVGGGDPRLCSAETGAIMTEKLVDIGARFIAHFASKTAKASTTA